MKEYMTLDFDGQCEQIVLFNLVPALLKLFNIPIDVEVSPFEIFGSFGSEIGRHSPDEGRCDVDGTLASLNFNCLRECGTESHTRVFGEGLKCF